MKLAAFDIEIFKEIPEGESDWKKHRPLGISCLAIMASDKRERPILSYADAKTPRPLAAYELKVAVKEMQRLANDGYVFVTVNGLGFDFDVLGEESGMVAECADLALNHHVDLMVMSVAKLGWPVGLRALAMGAGVESKLKEVTLKDGSTYDDMHGAKAPELWQAGEYEAVLAYLKQDVKATLETAEAALRLGYLGWFSTAGKWWKVDLPGGKLPIVADCLQWKRPDTSWMSNPLTRESLLAWTL